MVKLNRKISAGTIIATILLLTTTTYSDQALAATGVLEEGEDHIHFDLTLTVNITRTAFNMTIEEFEDEGQIWTSKWEEWKNRWEETHELGWRERWAQRIRDWASWAESLREEWRERWRAEWNETWKPEWTERWENWEEWMENWGKRWREIRFEDIEEIPEFLRAKFRERMMRRFEDLWERHVNASVLARCWTTPASQLGLKASLGQSLNKTLQRIYNTSDVYIKDFNLAIDLLTRTTLIDGAFMRTGIFNLTQSFDLYGVVIKNSSGTFIRGQFRHINVTERVDGGRFGYHGWVFTPAKAMFMDLSVFSVPLDKWNRTFDAAANTTTFALARDINVTTPFGSIIVDPELSLVVPGEASGVGDVIAIAPMLPTDLVPIKIIVPTMIVATLSLVAYYLVRRKTMMPRGYSSIL